MGANTGKGAVIGTILGAALAPVTGGLSLGLGAAVGAGLGATAGGAVDASKSISKALKPPTLGQAQSDLPAPIEPTPEEKAPQLGDAPVGEAVEKELKVSKRQRGRASTIFAGALEKNSASSGTARTTLGS